MKERKWVSLIEESKTNVPKFVPITNDKPDPKVKIIRDYILEKTMKKQVVSESEQDKINDFFSTSSWDDFEKHAKMIAQFIEPKDQKKIKEAIEQIKAAFISLGTVQGEGGDDDAKLKKGCETINKIQTILQKSGIATNGDKEGVIPEIKIRHFLDLLQDDTWTTMTGKLVAGSRRKHEPETHTKKYDVGLFIKMILSRGSRKLSSLLKKDITFGDILNHTMSKLGNKDDVGAMLRKIIRVDNYKKNNTNVGKAEIALALLFDDCSLPSTHGDICLQIKDTTQAIELKAMNAAFTNRTIRYPDLDKKRWSFIQTLKVKNPVGFQIRNITKDIDLKSSAISSQINNALSIIDNWDYPGEEGDKWALATKFKLLFGALFLSYANGTVETRKNGDQVLKGGFDKMLFVNTGDKGDAKKSNEDSPILTTPLVIIEPNKNADNWYNEGIRIMDDLLDQKLNIEFGDTFGQGGGFKVVRSSENGDTKILPRKGSSNGKTTKRKNKEPFPKDEKPTKKLVKNLD